MCYYFYFVLNLKKEAELNRLERRRHKNTGVHQSYVIFMIELDCLFKCRDHRVTRGDVVVNRREGRDDSMHFTEESCATVQCRRKERAKSFF